MRASAMMLFFINLYKSSPFVFNSTDCEIILLYDNSQFRKFVTAYYFVT